MNSVEMCESDLYVVHHLVRIWKDNTQYTTTFGRPILLFISHNNPMRPGVAKTPVKKMGNGHKKVNHTVQE